MKMMKKVLETLAGRGDSSSQELTAAKAEVADRIAAVEADIRNIDDREPHPAGRREVLLTGSADDLVELDKRLALLKAESKQLHHRRRELHDAIQQAQAREALGNVKGLHRELADAVAAAEKAMQAADSARASAKAAGDRILQARQICKSTGMPHDDLAVDFGLAKRAAAVALDGREHQVLMARELASTASTPKQRHTPLGGGQAA